MVTWHPVMRFEHYVLFGTWLSIHAFLSWVLATGHNNKQGIRHLHAVIWNGVACGWAIAWGWLFWDMFPLGRVAVVPLFRMGEVELQNLMGLAKIYAECTLLLHTYYSLTSFISGASTWRWLITHVLVLPASVALILLPRHHVIDASLLVVLISATLRYHLWLAADGFIALQLQLSSSTDKGWWSLAWHVACQFVSVYSFYELYTWFSDHWSLLHAGIMFVAEKQ